MVIEDDRYDEPAEPAWGRPARGFAASPLPSTPPLLTTLIPPPLFLLRHLLLPWPPLIPFSLYLPLPPDLPRKAPRPPPASSCAPPLPPPQTDRTPPKLALSLPPPSFPTLHHPPRPPPPPPRSRGRGVVTEWTASGREVRLSPPNIGAMWLSPPSLARAAATDFCSAGGGGWHQTTTGDRDRRAGVGKEGHGGVSERENQEIKDGACPSTMETAFRGDVTGIHAIM